VTADTVFVDFTMTVLVKAAVPSVPFTAWRRPPGIELNVRVTVLGSSRMFLLFVRPPGSGAVSSSSK
jgi:hypothetical protein